MASTQLIISGLIIFSTFVGVGLSPGVCRAEPHRLNTTDGSNGYYHYHVDQCRFSSFNLSDLEFIRSYLFNKAEYVVFNSTVGKYVGNTEFGVKSAEDWNNDPGDLEWIRARKDTYCRDNAQIDINNILTKTAEPKVRLRLTKASSGDQPAVLVCSAYRFYPKMINMTWYRDDQEVTGDVVSSGELVNGDWYYQMHSHLEFTPKAGEKISCMVEHASLKEPKELVWDSSMSEPERNKIAIGAAGLVLGLIVSAAGFIYYRTKARGRILVPNN